MKFRKTPLATVTLRYGLIAGVLAALLLVAIYYIGKHPMMVSPYLDYRILLFGVFIFFALKEVRDYHQNGALYFWQGMVGSYVITFIASTLGALGLILFASIEPQFISSYIDQRMHEWESFTQDEIELIGKQVYDSNILQLSTTNSMQLAITYFGQGIMIGLFISIILSVILRKQPKPL